MIVRKCYRILDLQLVIETDSEVFQRAFDRNYGWFAVGSLDGSPGMSISFMIGEGNQGASLRVDGKDLDLPDHPDLLAHANEVIGRLIMGSIKEYIIVHAAVVARGNRALVICGAPGAGKTTLVLELLRSGLEFLSDDFCPIHKEDRRVYPFPRSLRVTADSPPGAGSAGGPEERSRRRDKISILPGEGAVRVSEGPCTIGSLICLDPGEGGDRWCEVNVWVKGEARKAFLEAIAKLDGVVVKTLGSDRYEWRIVYPRGRGLTEQIRELLSRFRDDLYGAHRMDTRPADFAKTPILTPIAAHEAVFFILGELKQELVFGGEGADVSKTGIGGYFMTLSALLEGVPCYRLSPGKLDELRDLALATLS